MIFTDISHQDAKPFIEKWHYSGCVPTGKNMFFAWYDDNLDLYAVADYGIGVNPYQARFLSRETGYAVTTKNMMELKRLCRRDPPAADAYLTGFLAQCHKALRKHGIDFIVSFSDPAYGHCGGIYKAASFTYMGKTAAEMHAVDKDGNAVHRRLAYHHSRRHGITIQKSRELLELTRVKTVPKDRWFKVISR